MLVLSRQRNESIIIGDDITVTIVDVRGDKVRLGITAPNTVTVHREEIYRAIQRERNSSSLKATSNSAAAAPSQAPPAAAPPHTPAVVSTAPQTD